jgi:hypothetical protein
MKICIEFKEYKKAGLKEIMTRLTIASLILVILVLLFKDHLHY